MEASYTYKHFFKKNFPTKSTTTLGSTIWIKKIHYGARSPPKKKQTSNNKSRLENANPTFKNKAFTKRRASYQSV